MYTNNELIEVENLGNGFADVRVDGIETGGITDVDIDAVGVNYQVGDRLTFTANGVDTDVSNATGFVSVTGGGIQLEDSSDIIILESDTNITENFDIQLESRRG